MRKVFFCGNIVHVSDTNQIIGNVYSSDKNQTEIVLTNGNHVFTCWGTKDEKGNFIQFCSNFSKCKKRCFNQDETSNNCFYSTKYTKDIGMYVNTQSLKDVY